MAVAANIDIGAAIGAGNASGAVAGAATGAGSGFVLGPGTNSTGANAGSGSATQIASGESFRSSLQATLRDLGAAMQTSNIGAGEETDEPGAVSEAAGSSCAVSDTALSSLAAASAAPPSNASSALQAEAATGAASQAAVRTKGNTSAGKMTTAVDGQSLFTASNSPSTAQSSDSDTDTRTVRSSKSSKRENASQSADADQSVTAPGSVPIETNLLSAFHQAAPVGVVQEQTAPSNSSSESDLSPAAIGVLSDAPDAVSSQGMTGRVLSAAQDPNDANPAADSAAAAGNTADRTAQTVVSSPMQTRTASGNPVTASWSGRSDHEAAGAETGGFTASAPSYTAANAASMQDALPSEADLPVEETADTTATNPQSAKSGVSAAKRALNSGATGVARQNTNTNSSTFSASGIAGTDVDNANAASAGSSSTPAADHGAHKDAVSAQPQATAHSAFAQSLGTTTAAAILPHDPGSILTSANTGTTAGVSADHAESLRTGAAQETFTALDAGTSVGTPGWVHAGSRQAEAGFQDPSLGWVGVRADLSGGSVHASLVPGSAEAAQVLGTHLAGLNTYLTEQQTPVATLTVAAGANGMEPGVGQQMQQNAGQETGQGYVAQQFDSASGAQAIASASPLGVAATLDTMAYAGGESGRYVSVMA